MVVPSSARNTTNLPPSRRHALMRCRSEELQPREEARYPPVQLVRFTFNLQLLQHQKTTSRLPTGSVRFNSRAEEGTGWVRRSHVVLYRSRKLSLSSHCVIDRLTSLSRCRVRLVRILIIGYGEIQAPGFLQERSEPDSMGQHLFPRTGQSQQTNKLKARGRHTIVRNSESYHSPYVTQLRVLILIGNYSRTI